MNRRQNIITKTIIKSNPMMHLSHYKMSRSRRLGWSSLIMALFFCGVSGAGLLAQNLACNDLVNVSLEANCEVDISIDFILEDPPADLTFYQLIIEDQDGDVLPGTTVTGDYVGQTLKVTVRHIPSGISCWGNILIEDKFPPFFRDCDAMGQLPDATLDCDEVSDPDPADFPEVTGNCSDVDISWTDEVDDICGDGSGNTARIIRTWIATDQSGRTGTCEQIIMVSSGTFDDSMQCPDDWSADPADMTATENPYFRCDDDRLVDGVPPVSVTGEPTGISCPNLQYQFNDSFFDVCGASKKILRRWVILDWCTGQEYYCDQIIKIVDNIPPVFALREDEFEISRNQNCDVDLVFPKIETISDCSEVELNLAYKVKNDGQQPRSFDDYTTDNIVGPDGQGCFRVDDLAVPADSIWIAYQVVDECGNESVSFNEIAVIDDKAPNAICETNTVVSLNSNGWSEAFAASFDDHSFDYCSDIVSFEVKRLSNFCPGYASDLSYGPSVYFCCEDVARSPVQVMLKVIDSFGNSNECIVNVNVQDKQQPIITFCPPSVTVDCEMDITDPDNTGGYPRFTSVCSADVSFSDIFQVNECGIGSVVRRWTVTSSSGLSTGCTQIINLVMLDPVDYSSIRFPKEFYLDACTAEQATPELCGEPTYLTTDCSSLTSGFKDLLLYDFEGQCIKIIREWTVIDWCQYTSIPNGPEIGIWKGSQTIFVKNTQRPQFVSDCTAMEFHTSAGNCEGWADLLASAQDDCTRFSDLVWKFDIDLHYKANLGFRADRSGNRQVASDIYPVGKHKIKFSVADLCGNVETCEYPFEIKETKAPTPICFSTLSFSLGPDGQVDVWASEFEKGSQDNCSTYNELSYSFSPNPNDTQRTFTCDDVPNGVINTVPIRMYVTDSNGNSEFCNAEVKLSDNFDVCPDDPNAAGTSAMIAGYILSESSVGVEDVTMSLTDTNTDQVQSYMTDADGSFAFEDVTLLKDYTVQPASSDNDPLNGVSTLDLVLIQRYLLGIDTDMSPYKMIAADVNRSQSISAADLIEMRKILLGITDQWSNNDNWNFIPSDTDFSNGAFPLLYNSDITIEQLLDNHMDIDFVAIKTGDVNDNAIYNLDQDTEIRNKQELLLNIDSEKDEANKLIVYTLHVEKDFDLQGFQLTFSYDDTELVFEQITSSAFALTSEHIGLTPMSEGELSISWSDPVAAELTEGQAVLELVFSYEGDLPSSSSLEFSTDRLLAEAYDKELNVYALKLKNSDASELVSGAPIFSLDQNSPNPFDKATTINIRSQMSTDAHLSISTMDGKLVYSKHQELSKGDNRWQIRPSQLQGNGIYFYTVRVGQQSLTRRMIMIE